MFRLWPVVIMPVPYRAISPKHRRLPTVWSAALSDIEQMVLRRGRVPFGAPCDRHDHTDVADELVALQVDCWIRQQITGHWAISNNSPACSASSIALLQFKSSLHDDHDPTLNPGRCRVSL